MIAWVWGDHPPPSGGLGADPPRTTRCIDDGGHKRKTAEFASNPWFIITANIASIVSFLTYLYDKSSIAAAAIYILFLAILLFGIVYSVEVRKENIVLKDIASVFNEINHIYRNSLKDTFGGNDPITDSGDLLDAEKRVLMGICQRIGNVFSSVTRRDCMVTIKISLKDNDGRCFAYTYVRSQEMCLRDNSKIRYAVGTGENTAFDQSLVKRPEGEPSHFFSSDLTKEKQYSNQRQSYKTFYRSTLVVPIRGTNKGEEGTANEYDEIGFLCLDTKSTNRLNDGYHLQMLLSLAGQMYNYMSLMRGKYTVFVEQRNDV